MKNALISWPAAFLALFLPLSGYGGTIRTSVTTTHVVTDEGAVEVDVRIRNNGDVTAHRIAVTLTLDHIIRRFPLLGDNPPGGEIRLKERLEESGLKPGTYVAVVRVDFEEQAGRSHHCYHFFKIPYRTDDIPAPGLPLEVKTTGPCLNRKAFWNKDDSIALSVKNNSQEKILLNARLFLPEGFTSPTPDRAFRLNPGETKTIEIPLHLDPGGKNLSPYRLVVWRNHDHAHFSWDLKGVIRVEDRPVYFKAYLVSGVLVLVVVFGLLLFRSPPPRNRPSY